MRILIAHNVPGRASGGMTRIMSFLHEGLRQAGHTIEYLCAEDLPAQWNGSKARFGFPYLVHRHTSQAARVGKPYDIINVHEPSGALVSWWKSVRRPGRIVVTSHGIEERGWQIHLAERRKHGASVPIKSRVLYPSTVLWQARLALRKADHVFCLNTQDRNYLIEHLGRKPDSITRIYPGAAPVYVPVARNRCYAAATRWLFAGTWNERKGVRYFSESFTRLAAEHPQVSLCVLGAGVPQDEVRSYFPEALRSRVSTVQTTSDEENARVL
ncbi:MAG TPA: glycosyltransferase family 4 protein, partial [Bryobacteraceae bacterium]|nr:glycosyltransferase family 4 protein [Bryobacteraceae bacterium]